MKPITLAKMTIQRVAEIDRLELPATMMFPTIAPETLVRARHWLDNRFLRVGSDDIAISFHSYVVRTKHHTVLIDTCWGNDKERPGMPMAHRLNTDYLGNLARIGLKPEDIDIVLCTHLHFDHVGWNTRLDNGRWVPTFPRAKYLMTRADYEYFDEQRRAPPEVSWGVDSFEDSILPVVAAGQAEFVDDNHVIERELADGLWLEGAPGHTPGSALLHAKCGGSHALFTGDVIHHPLQLADTTLHIDGEFDSTQGIATRQRICETYADTDTILLAAHFPSPTAGRVVSARHGFEFRWLG